MPTDPSLLKYARRLERVEKQLRDLSTTPRLGNSSIENGGALRLNDAEGNTVTLIGQQPDGSVTVQDVGGDAPATPSAPLVAQLPGGITVSWDGFDDTGEAIPWDSTLGHISVRVSTVPSVELDPGEAPVEVARLFASKSDQYGGSATLAQPSDVTTYVTLVAVRRSGVESDPSAEVEATGGEYASPADLLGLEAALDAAELELEDLQDLFPIQSVSIADDAITTPKLLAESVVTAKLAAGAITTPKIAVGAIKAEQMDVNVLRAGFTITGKIEVGTHTWTPNEGFIIPGVVVLPGIAGGTAEFTGSITATALTVQKDLTLLGNTNKIAGTLTLANGITRPTTTPSVYQSWSLVGSHELFGPIRYGLTEHLSDSTLLLTAEAFTGGAIASMLKSDGSGWVPMANGDHYGSEFASTYKAYLDDFYPHGITTQGSNYFLIGTDAARGGAWYIYKLDSSFDKIAELSLSGEPIVGRPTIGKDATGIVLAYAISPNTLRTTYLTTALGFSGVTDHATFTGIGNSNLSFIGVGSYDFGATRVVAAVEGIKNFVFTTASDRLSDAYAFAAANGHTVRGLWYDGTRFWSYGSDGSLYKHGSNAGAQAVTVSNTWYDGDSGGTGTHETEETTNPASFTRAPRTYLNVRTDEAPDSGITAGGTPDKANRVGVYVGVGGGSRRWQIYNGVDGSGRSIRDSVFDVINTGSALPPSSNGFVGAANSPGIFKTFGATSTQGVTVNGDGSGTIAGLAFNAAGAFTNTKFAQADSGWLSVNAAGGAAPAYEANWANLGFTWQDLQYRKIGPVVHVRGVAARNTSGSAANAIIATLPAGFRPTTGIQRLDSMWTNSGAFASDQVAINGSGHITTAVAIPAGGAVFIFGSFFVD